MASTKIGDIFSVKLDDGTLKYFQLIAFDILQLNSDVIRGFKKAYAANELPGLTEVVNDKVEFYTHCVTKLGLKLNLWDKVGNISDVGNIDIVLFRSSLDSGARPGEQVHISYRWNIWRLTDANRTYVGSLEEENRKAELGIIVNPYDVVNRIKTGKFSFFYPGY